MPDGFVEESGPVFLSFGTNVNALTVGESLVFSAVVTDPDGIDDLIGGTLKGSGNIQYGSFSTSAQEGAYSMTLSWAQVHQTDPLEFVGEEYRTFVAEFFDVAGHRATQTIQIRFWCEVAACNGGCHDINNDVTACGSSCKNCSSDDKWGYPQCVEGSCIGAYEFSTVASCDDHCSNKGGVCIKPAKPSEIESCDAMFSISGAEGIYSYYPDGANPSIKYYECSETPAATKSPDIPFVEIRCCCKY